MLSSLAECIDTAPRTEKALVTVNRQGPDTLLSLLRRAFENQGVSLGDVYVPEGDDDVVLLVEDGRVTATSPMAQLRDTFLLVNTDYYRTGPNLLDERAVPDVLAGLSDVEFHVRGFPASAKEKLVLVVISRLIEGRALSAAEGTYHVGFQYLARLDAEGGTRAVHERLAETALDVHIYGGREHGSRVADALDATVHAAGGEELRRSWFVVYEPPDGGPEHIALVAVLVGDNEWRAVWTESRELVEETATYLETALQSGTRD